MPIIGNDGTSTNISMINHQRKMRLSSTLSSTSMSSDWRIERKVERMNNQVLLKRGYYCVYKDKDLYLLTAARYGLIWQPCIQLSTHCISFHFMYDNDMIWFICTSLRLYTCTYKTDQLNLKHVNIRRIIHWHAITATLNVRCLRQCIYSQYSYIPLFFV